jgi:RimJ/RimL family protein N-acetyltransferase
MVIATGYIVVAPHRISVTREPTSTRAPSFVLVRSADSCEWAVGAHVEPELAARLDALAQSEPPSADLRAPLVNAYPGIVESGPSFRFPYELPEVDGIVTVETEEPLIRHFKGWKPGEIAAGYGPVFAIAVDGAPVSVCFCARKTDDDAAAGVETAEAFRGRGFAPRVTIAWARAMHASGREPGYGTAWTNHASLAVARKLGLVPVSNTWKIA